MAIRDCIIETVPSKVCISGIIMNHPSYLLKETFAHMLIEMESKVASNEHINNCSLEKKE